MRRSAPVRFGTVRARLPLAAPGQRIGLVGGSFNPPHAAHRLISQTAIRRLGLDRVWWIVTPGNPLKGRTRLLPLGERLVRARHLAADQRITVTAFEQDLPTAFTAATLAFLTARYPATRFVWLMGADCLVEFHRWQHWREVFARMPIAVIDRPGLHLHALAAPAARAFAARRLPEGQARLLPGGRPPRWVFLTGRLSPLSSTAIRGAPAG